MSRKRFVDKLVKLSQQGEEVWVLLHIEVQSQYETNFAQRMFTYHYRIFDRYKRKVASLVVLGDESQTWRPSEFGYSLFGSKITFQFPVVKLLDLEEDWQDLEVSDNPFAVVVMAHLKANQTKKDTHERLRWKVSLIKGLYEKGYQRQDVINLFRFIDWVMNLPESLTREFWQEVYQLEEEKQMPYISSIERLGFQKGLVEGRQEGELSLILKLLNRQIGEISPDLANRIRQLPIEQLEALGEALLDFSNEGDLIEWLTSHS